jgi:formate dehydrogenase subunit gamma
MGGHRGASAVLTHEEVGEPDVTHAFWVTRFGRTERLLHWWIVSMFATALLSGLAMGDEAGSGAVMKLHVGSVALIGVGVIASLVFGNSRAVLRSARDLLVFNRLDITWLVARVRHPFRIGGEPRWGKFNAGQKLLAWALMGSVGALIATGVQSWSTGGDSGGPHAAAAVVAVLLLGAHVFMAVLNPATRPALPGMIFGHVRRSWAAKHHRGWLDDVDNRSAP